MVRVLYLGGLGRSGTTLLERLLGELPGVCPLGEVVHLWARDVRDNERCGCGTPFAECPRWQRIGQRAFGGWDNVNVTRVLALRAAVERTRHIPRLAAQRRPDPRVVEYVDYYRKIYEAAAEESGEDLLIDSSKHAALAYCLRFSPEIDLRVAHVVRDSRGVAYSWTKHVPRPEAHDNDEMTRYRPAHTAMLWNTHNAAFGLLGNAGVPVHRVQYERLVADPAGTLKQVGAFAGLPVDDDAVAFARAEELTLRRHHTAAGNPMRFSTGAVSLRRDDAWRVELPARQRRLVAALTAPMMAAYGYPVRSS